MISFAQWAIVAKVAVLLHLAKIRAFSFNWIYSDSPNSCITSELCTFFPWESSLCSFLFMAFACSHRRRGHSFRRRTLCTERGGKNRFACLSRQLSMLSRKIGWRSRAAKNLGSAHLLDQFCALQNNGRLLYIYIIYVLFVLIQFRTRGASMPKSFAYCTVLVVYVRDAQLISQSIEE